MAVILIKIRSCYAAKTVFDIAFQQAQAVVTSFPPAPSRKTEAVYEKWKKGGKCHLLSATPPGSVPAPTKTNPNPPNRSSGNVGPKCVTYHEKPENFSQ
ncbi:unnamed protein product, partial [Tetraodon nigroviridis]